MSASAAVAGLTAGAGLIVAIGAQNAFVLRQSLARQHTRWVVAVCTLSDMALILLGVAGMDVVVSAWPAVLDVLRWGGIAFLSGYGALAAWRAWRGQSQLTLVRAAGGQRRQVVLACLAFTFLNPHVYLDTMVLLGSLAAQYPGTGRWAFAAGACLASVLWFSALGYGARLLQPWFARPRAWRVLDALVAALMLSLALALYRGAWL